MNNYTEQIKQAMPKASLVDIKVVTSYDNRHGLLVDASREDTPRKYRMVWTPAQIAKDGNGFAKHAANHIINSRWY